MSNYKGRKAYPPGRKKSELICLKVTPAQFRMYMKLGERFWLRKMLDAELEKGGLK